MKSHPIKRLIERFVNLLDATYTGRLTSVGLKVGIQKSDKDQGAEIQSDFSAEAVSGIQDLGSALLADLEEFLSVCKKITSFFYRQCFSLDNHLLQDTIVESITQILFTAQKQK